MIGRVLGPLLAPFLERHSELEVELVADTRHLSLLRRDADVAIRLSKFETSDIVQRRAGAVGFGLYASDAYLTARGMLDFTLQCEGHALIAMSESLAKIVDVGWLATVASKARIAIRTNGREPMTTMAAAGIGIACLPRFLGDRTATLRLLPVPGSMPERPLWIGFHGDARSIPRIKATTTFLAEGIARMHRALCPDGR